MMTKPTGIWDETSKITLNSLGLSEPQAGKPLSSRSSTQSGCAEKETRRPPPLNTDWNTGRKETVYMAVH